MHYKFHSPFARLIVYHQGQKIAQFVDGYFETTDSAVAQVLRIHSDIVAEEKRGAREAIDLGGLEVVATEPEQKRPARVKKAA